MLDPHFAFSMLAQADGGNAPQSPLPMLMPLIFLGILFYFLVFRPQRREQRRRQELLDALKKNDRVVTAGGIVGTVANMHPDGKEVTIKVEEGRIRLLRSSIQSIITDDAAPGAETR